MITTIIPIFNEEKALLERANFYKRIAAKTELIFVDGGSRDKSIEIASSYGRVLNSISGRGIQMNHGAEYASGDVLLFLHADTAIGKGIISSIEKKLDHDEFIGGCMMLRIDKQGIVYRLIEGFGNVRARITRVFYGDQGIYVKKDMFFKIGCYPNVPIMEDVIFSKKLRMAGKTTVLPDKILVSPRRWEAKGVAPTILRYTLINILFWFGVSLEKIKLFYGDVR